jgi:hypothetical protein
MDIPPLGQVSSPIGWLSSLLDQLRLVSLYILGTYHMEDTASSSSSIVAFLSMTVALHLLSHYLAADNFFWLHYPAFQVSCYSNLKQVLLEWI